VRVPGDLERHRTRGQTEEAALAMRAGHDHARAGAPVEEGRSRSPALQHLADLDLGRHLLREEDAPDQDVLGHPAGDVDRPLVHRVESVGPVPGVADDQGLLPDLGFPDRPAQRLLALRRSVESDDDL